MKRKLTAALAVWAVTAGVWMSGSAQGFAQEKPKPFVTASFAGYDELSKVVEMVGKLGGQPGLSKAMDMPLEMMVPEGLQKVFAKQKPWGVVVKATPDGGNVQVQGFIPLGESEDLRKTLESANAKITETGKSTFKIDIETPFQTISVLIAQKKDWTLIANSAEALADIPDDPGQLLGDLPKKYLVGVNLAVKNIPEGLRQKVLQPLMFALEMNKQQRKPGETDEQVALRSKMLDQAMGQFDKMLKELDTLQIGLNVDPKTSTAYLDFAVTALPGTETAKRAASSQGLTSNFAGLIPADAAASLRMVGKIDPTGVSQLKLTLAGVRSNALGEVEKQGLSEEQLKQAKQVIGDLLDVLEKTIEGGTLDAAAMLKIEPQKTLLVAGNRIAEGAKLNATLKQLFDQAVKDNPGVVQVLKLNAEEYAGVKFHVLSLPTEALGDGAKPLALLFGDKVTAILGIGDTSLYAAVGNDPAGELRKAIDQAKAQAGKTVPPMELVVAVAPIVRLASGVADGQAKPMLEQVVKLLEAAAGKDHVRVTVKVIENGTQTRLEVEEGLLKVLGSLATMRGGG